MCACCAIHCACYVRCVCVGRVFDIFNCCGVYVWCIAFAALLYLCVCLLFVLVVPSMCFTIVVFICVLCCVCTIASFVFCVCNVLDVFSCILLYG